MRRAWLFVLAACSKPAPTIVGDTFTVEVPRGWRIAPDDAPAMFPAIRTVRPWVLATNEQPRALPAIAIHELVAPRPPQPVVEGATVERCRATAKELGLVADTVYVLDRGSDAGCDLRNADGRTRTAVLRIGDAEIVITCKREADAPRLDEACERLVQTLHSHPTRR